MRIMSVLGLATLASLPSLAAERADALTVQSFFEIEITASSQFGVPVGQRQQGFVTFDDALLGTAQLLLPAQFSLEFDLFGITVTEEDDIDFGSGLFPTASIDATGQVTALSYETDVFDALPDVAAATGGAFVALGTPTTITFFDVSDSIVGEARADLVSGPVAVIPLPPAAAMLLAGLAGLGLVATRRRATA